MPNPSIAPWKALYSRDYYRGIGRGWDLGTAILHLLIVLAVCWVALTIRMGISLHRYARPRLSGAFDRIPEFAVQKGEISVNVQQPYRIEISSQSKDAIVIDTTGKLTSLEQADARVLIMRSQIHAYDKDDRRQYRVIPISQSVNFEANRGRIEGWKSVAGKFWTAGEVVLISFLWVFALVGSFAYRLVQGTICALIGVLFGELMKIPIRYEAAFRLSLVALTPVILLKALRWAFGFPRIPFMGWITLGMVLGYLAFAVQSQKDEPAAKTEGGA